MNRDDRIHGALLILNELVRISSMEGEVRNCSCGAQAPVPVCQQAGTPLSSQGSRQDISGSSKSCENHDVGSEIVGLGLEG